MKAFILAAGNGTRLRPLTNTVPKCMAPICGVPLLAIWLEWCRTYGISEVLVNVHAHAGEVIRFLCGDFGVTVTISYEHALLGSAGTLYANREFIENEKQFAILYADVLTNCAFDQMLEFHCASRSRATLGLYTVPNPRECGIARIDDTGRVIDFVEKPESPSGNLAFSGIMIATPAILQFLTGEVPSDIGTHLLPLLVNQMHGYLIRDYLIDIGSKNKYARAQREWPGLNFACSAASRTD